MRKQFHVDKLLLRLNYEPFFTSKVRVCLNEIENRFFPKHYIFLKYNVGNSRNDMVLKPILR